MKKAVLSISGGMDSTGLLLHLLREGYEVRCYSFDYGQRHKIELERLSNNIQYLKEKCLEPQWEIIDLKSVFKDSTSALLPQSGVEVPEGHYEDSNMVKTVVENRNAIFSSIIYGKALAWANQTEKEVVICLGIHAGDHQIYPDCKQESRDALAEAFRVSNWGSERISYYTPYLEKNKISIIRDALQSCEKLEIDFNTIFKNTNTCYNPTKDGKACGKCGSCVERLEAFLMNNIFDPIEYVR